MDNNMNIDLWFPNYGKNPGIISKILRNEINTQIESFNAKVIESNFLDFEHFQINLQYEDEEYVEYIVNSLRQSIGYFPDPATMRPGDRYHGRIIDPGKVGFGIFIDVGLRLGGQHNDGLLPLYELRNNTEMDTSCKQIVSVFGLTSGLPIDVELTEIEIESSDSIKPSFKLTDQTIEQFETWIDMGNDRLIVTKAFEKDVRDAIQRENVNKYINEIISHDPLTTELVCRENTNASGLIPKIGRNLMNAPIGIFSPSKIEKIRD